MTLNQYTPEEPITSIATALAPAALGIIRVSGKNSIQLVSKVFSRPKALLEAAGNTVVYGWIVDNNGTKIDEVMCAVYRAPKSFTGEDMVEIFCHGGPSVVTAIQNLMLKSGFRQANRGEYTFRAYINGKTDLTKAEAVKEIIDSHTDVSRSHAVGRLSGSLFAQIDEIKKLIIDTLAAIEVEIEYPEDEETIADTFNRSDIETAINRLQTLVDSWRGEKLYQDGARVVLAGRTNAGKSSLFNAILKEERAIVSDIEGTTRDWLESWASINGIPVRLFDTAGLRQTDDVIEARGVELTKNLAGDADIVFYLIDSTSKITAEDLSFIKNAQEPLIVVYTKTDINNEGESLPPGSHCVAHTPPSAHSDAMRNAGLNPIQVAISSKDGSGMKTLFDEAAKLLTSGLTTEREQAGIGSERQKNAVAEALECVKHALVSADDNYTLDAVVQDLEDALDFLGEVTGDVTPDDVLGSIFANFCVGK
ncbi:MAG: tRNA uridine-5-carboxymethylaminomethyl(34) synthesis GTPase MnmE [Treponema sp.]|nr:tRNA uridine-5-carboxymethylaminomethyl(34) synthesis GTPase MnmE [Treponema sp.]